MSTGMSDQEDNEVAGEAAAEVGVVELAGEAAGEVGVAQLAGEAAGEAGLATEMSMLDYENEMFLSALQEDGLTVAAKGLSLERIFLSLLKVYADPGNLVLVLGCSDKEEEWFREQMEGETSSGHLKKITTDISTSDREQVYKEGGVLFITTRILVVDLLMERIPVSLITGILIYRAHRIIDSCQDSFILRLYRQGNREGFIKAFSAAPVAFTTGFCKVERVMKNLFIRNLHLWPRFHKTVSSSLAVSQPEVIELHLELTHKMQELQTALLELVSYTVKDIKRLNPTLETEELTVENAISSDFYKILQNHLDPIWHQLSWKTKQMVGDLKTIKTLMTYLTQYDCITFYSLISALRTAESAMRSSGWVLQDAAETLFLAAKERVFASLETAAAAKKKKTDSKPHSIEENPKWRIISDIMEEIRTEVNQSVSDPEEKVKVLIVVRDDRTARQLQDYLDIGSERLLARMFNKALGEKYGRLPETEDRGSREAKDKGQGKKSHRTAPSGEVDEGGTSSNSSSSSSCVETVVHGLDSRSSLQNVKLLSELRPRYILLYDAEVTFVRQVEVYQAHHPALPTRVYFIMYRGSVEEQSYLTSLKREQAAFDKLIREKSTMVVPEDREGKTGDNQDLNRDGRKASELLLESRNLSSRKGGGGILLNLAAKVIVDMREFRSDLPSLLHKRGIDIEPITLEVGDYILTPEICVERKSISDLIGSLNSGRLYNQATAMTRFYSKPMLLIEFDENKPFALQGKFYMSKDLQSSDLVARLQLLTLHFPKLRILWSPSPHATAELFDELKKGRDQPDASKAATIGVDIIDDFNVDKYNPQIRDFLSKLPGITSKNIFSILNKVENMLDLLQMSEESLAEIMGGSKSASQVFSALHSPIQVPETEPKQEKKVLFKRKKFSKKT